jgi:signal transduction histidine kinase
VTPEELFARVGDAFSGRIAQTGEPALMLDTARDERIASPALRRSARSLWGVPMKTENAIIGVLLIGFPKPYEWLPTERELLRAIADRTALAIHRARITDTLRERETRIAELSGHLLRVQEQERKRISRELHDETGQALMVIRLYLGMLENSTSGRGTRNKIRETLAVVDRTIDGIRRIIARLSPLVLQELGLIAAIRKEAKDLAKATGVKARVAAPDAIGRLGPETEAAIYRVVQEALHNVAKHAQAKSVNIQIGRENGKLKLLVEDDGVGMAPSRNLPGHSFGLVGIKERIAMLGGEVRVVSARGKGTRIEVIVPAEDVGQPLAAVAAAPGGVHA